ncbi:ABC transporter ATP-binding protein [Novacetimonas hansenii]|uniref:ABC transporter ATP-binding protein n=1 Tax=Novacetimonas TaxID=2919364 RepID=UPI000789ACE4|nr:ABC transporter ATP-binding protein [Novacetimonas hansenii]PYD74137.1 ABC transporter ATP-binding protein [Novacetimonas hansenii]QOF94026.1 ABC transporter ATP-binding protein [Novacetimonas hansenii]RFP01165.1 peptide ABC transporter ATP-binding protein [Novacetimonas hansenii]WEQ59477.1 ABC transporter ATP-binding protein [Novacetimonas hansenii]CUW46882.1 Oligopeptide transport ATP-binding protein OppD [Novacetimonas hansenii]
MTVSRPVLSVEGLHIHFHTRRGTVHAVDDVTFDINPGEIVALVGESGSGKSVTSLSMMGLLPRIGRIAGGRLLFQPAGQDIVDLATAPEKALRKVRGGGIGMIFQEPMTSLNPAMTVGEQIAEALVLHGQANNHAAMARAADLLAAVGIANPHARVRSYPHQMSGGMRQRVMIAIAIACRPALLIADEPTTALDVTTQAQILDILKQLRHDTGMAVLFITHNLSLVEAFADRVMVMYAGQVVEYGRAADVMEAPRHPYARALLDCLPVRHLDAREGATLPELPTIRGHPPDLAHRPAGCAFATRCDMVRDACRAGHPDLQMVNAVRGHATRCIAWPEMEGGTDI